MRNATRLLAILGAAMAVGGCQSFPLTSWMFKDRPGAASARTTLAGNTTGALEEGKAFLRDGNISAAVASFRIALLDPSAVGEAHNGLAVAYAKLGRADLAERYFRAAIEVEPDNPKFVANLFRLQGQVLLARSRQAPAVETQALAMAPAPVAASSREALSGPAQRVSRAEVLVRSQPETASAPAMAVVYRDALDGMAETDPPKDDKLLATADTGFHPITVVFGE